MSVKAGDRRKVKDAPPSDQVAAVRKLVQALDLPRARQRLAALRAAYPAFKPLYGLAWEIEDAGGYPMAACAAAWVWHQASPGSRAALEALVDNARRAMLAGLHARAQHRLRQLDDPDAQAPLEHIDAPLGRLTLAEAGGLDPWGACSWRMTTRRLRVPCSKASTILPRATTWPWPASSKGAWPTRRTWPRPTGARTPPTCSRWSSWCAGAGRAAGITDVCAGR
jgi:hypothetical protein